MDVRTATLAIMRGLGVEVVFGTPESAEGPVLRELPGQFRCVLAAHEASAVAIACGYAQAARKPAFVSLRDVLGLGNAAGNVVAARRNRIPLVIAASPRAHPTMWAGAWLRTDNGGVLHAPHAKWSGEASRPEDVPATIERAYRTAAQPPRGPVFVSMPAGGWTVPVEPRPPRTVHTRRAPDPAALSRIAQAFGTSERPAVVLGAGVDPADVWSDAVALAERARAAVWSAPGAWRATFPGDHPLFQGFLPLAPAPLAEALNRHDLVLAVGAPALLYAHPAAPDGVRAATTLFHIADDPDEAARAASGESVVGDLGLTLRDLRKLLPETDRAPPTSGRRPSALEAAVGHAMRAIRQVLPRDGVVVEELPADAPALHEHIAGTRAGGFYGSAGFEPGYGLPTAVGVQLADESRQVVGVFAGGPGSRSAQSLWTAAQQRLPSVFVVLRSGGRAATCASGVHWGTSSTLGFDPPTIDFVAVARGFGCEAERVTRPSEFAPVLAQALSRARALGRPCLIEVATGAESTAAL